MFQKRTALFCLCVVSLVLAALALPAGALAAYPQLVGECSLPSSAQGVAVAGDYAYVADGGSGLQVVDVSTPSSPVIVGHCSLPGYARDVAVAGDYAYVADGGSGLQVVDVSTPSAPVAVGSAGWDISTVVVAGTYAYVAGGALEVFDLSDPETPVSVGAVGLYVGWDVAVAGHYAYVPGDGLKVIDVAIPATPAIVGSCNVPGSPMAVGVTGSLACVAAIDLQIVDVGNAASPVVVGSVDLPGVARRVAAAGDFAYVAGDESYPDGDGDHLLVTLQVVDVSTPAAPALVGSCALEGSAEGIALSGDHVYLAGRDGADQGALRIVDLGRPADADAVRLTAQASPEQTAYKGRVTVTGELRDTLGALLPGRTLSLQTSTDGITWSNLKQVASDTGAYSTTTTVVRKTYFRWRYAGDATYADGVSPASTVLCSASLTPLAMPSVVRRGVLGRSFGYLRPQHAKARAFIAISFERYVSGRWRPAGGLSDNHWRNVVGATRYWVYYRITAAGKWRTRAMHEDRDHVHTYSAYRTFVVR